MTGTRGPVGKRKEDLKGHRSRDELRGADVVAITPTYANTPKAPQPKGSGSWEPYAKRLWKAMGQSQQCALYEPTDWEYARTLVSDLDVYKQMGKRNSQLLTTIYAGFDKLLLTEGSRRRLGIESEKRETPIKQPPANRDWDTDAKRMWKAMVDSEQSAYYEESDWAVAYCVMEDLTKYRESDYRSGALMQAIQSALSSLMVTEGDRRRMSLDLHKSTYEATGVTAGELEMNRWLAQLTT